MLLPIIDMFRYQVLAANDKSMGASCCLVGRDLLAEQFEMGRSDLHQAEITFRQQNIAQPFDARRFRHKLDLAAAYKGAEHAGDGEIERNR